MKYKLKLQRVIRTGEEDVEAPFIDTVELEKLPGDHIYEYPGKEGYYKILGVIDNPIITYLPSVFLKTEGPAPAYTDVPTTQPPDTHNAEYYLKTAQEAMRARAQLRDKPTGERSMESTVKAFNALTGHNLSEQEGWEFMVLLKMVRGRQGTFNPDDYVDGPAYFALLGECNAKKRT